MKTLTWRGQRLESKSKEKVELRGYRICGQRDVSGALMSLRSYRF